MIMHRTCISCDQKKPWREMVKWTTDPELEQKWSTALTANDCEKKNLEERVADLRSKNTIVYLCESHFDENRAFTLTPSGYMLRPNAVPKNTRKKPLNDSSKKNSKLSNNKKLASPSPTVTPNSKKESPRTKRKQEDSKKDEVPPKKKTPSPPPELETTTPMVQIPPSASTDAAHRGEEKKSNNAQKEKRNEANGVAVVKKGEDATSDTQLPPTDPLPTATSIFPSIPSATEEKKEEEVTGVTNDGTSEKLADIQTPPIEHRNTASSIFPPPPIATDEKTVTNVGETSETPANNIQPTDLLNTATSTTPPPPTEGKKDEEEATGVTNDGEACETPVDNIQLPPSEHRDTASSIFPPPPITTEEKKDGEETTGVTNNGEASERPPVIVQPTDHLNTPTCVTPTTPNATEVEEEVEVGLAKNRENNEVNGVEPVAAEEGEAVVKMEEIEDVDEHRQDALASLEERIEAKLAEAEAEEAAAAHAEEILDQSDPALDPVDDCIASVIRQATRPPSPPPMKLVKPNLSYEALCYEAFEYIERNFQQSKLTMANICFYISNKYRYYASGIMWRKQVFRALNIPVWMTIERLDVPTNKEEDSLYSLNREEYSFRIDKEGELRVKLLKKKIETVDQANSGTPLNGIGSTPAVVQS